MFISAFWKTQAFLDDLFELRKHKLSCTKHYIEEVLWKQYIKHCRYEFSCRCYGG